MAGARTSEYLRVGLAQLRSGLTHAANRSAVESAVRALAAQGAQLIATPEMTGALDGKRDRLRSQAALEQDDPTLALLRDLSAELKVWILLGSDPILPEPQADRFVNRSLLIDGNGNIAARYDKIHLFDVDLPSGERYRESGSYRPGDTLVVAQTPWGGLGLSICYDVRFAYLYRALAKAGARVLTVPAAFTHVTGRAHWHVLLQARAIETGCFVLAPAQTGTHEDGRKTYGHSLIVSPWGEILGDGGEDEGILVADLDLSLVDEARQRIPALTHDRDIHVQRTGDR